MTIFFNFYITSSHLHPLQVENCDSNSRLVVDDNVKSSLKGLIEHQSLQMFDVKVNKFELFIFNHLNFPETHHQVGWVGPLTIMKLFCLTFLLVIQTFQRRDRLYASESDVR